MPIKDLSETRRLPRGGKLRMGIKKKTDKGKEYPAATDYLVMDCEDEEITKRFHELYGDKPKRVTVAFASDDTEEIFSQWYKCHGGSKLHCRGDGECATRYEDDGSRNEVKCVGPEECEFSVSKGTGDKPGCAVSANLQYFIKGLPTLCVFQTDTGGINSIINVNSGIALLELVRSGKSIKGVWVDLVLKPREVTKPDNNKRIIVHVLDIVIPIGLDQIQQLECVFEQRPLLEEPARRVEPKPEASQLSNQLRDIHTMKAAVRECGMDEDIVGAYWREKYEGKTARQIPQEHTQRATMKWVLRAKLWRKLDAMGAALAGDDKITPAALDTTVLLQSDPAWPFHHEPEEIEEKIEALSWKAEPQADGKQAEIPDDDGQAF